MANTRDDRPQPAAPDNGANTLARVMTGASVVALAALALFMAQNLQRVDINFLWFDWHTRMLWALLIAAAFGGISTIIAGALTRRRVRRGDK